MTLNWHALTVACRDAGTLAAFWSGATGWAVAEAVSSGRRVVLRPGGALPELVFDGDSALPADGGRLRIDLTTEDFDAQLRHLVKLGAIRLRDFPGGAIFTDPEGNEFTLFEV